MSPASLAGSGLHHAWTGGPSTVRTAMLGCPLPQQMPRTSFMHTSSADRWLLGRTTSAHQTSCPSLGASSVIFTCSSERPGQSCIAATPAADLRAQQPVHHRTPRTAAQVCVAALLAAYLTRRAAGGAFAHPALVTGRLGSRLPSGGLAAGHKCPAAATNRAVATASSHSASSWASTAGETRG